jgi:hypothetical protein
VRVWRLLPRHTNGYSSLPKLEGEMTNRACPEACVKEGAKYVFVSKGKVYQIANQTDPSLDPCGSHGDIDGQDERRQHLYRRGHPWGAVVIVLITIETCSRCIYDVKGRKT